MTLAAELANPRASLLSRLDPRWRIAGLLIWSFVAAIVVHLPASMVALAGSLFLYMTSGLSAAWLWRRLLGLLPFVILFAIPLVLVNGILGTWSAVLLIIKTLAIALPLFVVVGTTNTIEVSDFLTALHVPRRLISMFVLSERSGTLLAAQFNRMRRAMCIRGFRWRANRRTYATVATAVGATTVRGFDQSTRFSRALACRGFCGKYRQWRSYTTTFGEVEYAALCAMAGNLLVLWDRWLGI